MTYFLIEKKREDTIREETTIGEITAIISKNKSPERACLIVLFVITQNEVDYIVPI